MRPFSTALHEMGAMGLCDTKSQIFVCSIILELNLRKLSNLLAEVIVMNYKKKENDLKLNLKNKTENGH